MTNRKKLRARQHAAKRRRAAKQLEKLKLDLQRAEAVAAAANNTLDAARRTLAGKVMVVLHYSAQPDMHGGWGADLHRLEAQPAEWVGNRLHVAGDRLCTEMRVMDVDVQGSRDAAGFLAYVRKKLGSDIGAALMRNMRPRRN